MKTKFIISFFIIGLVLSLVCGFVVGNRIIHIISIAAICSVGLALVGMGAYTILEQKVPEFIGFLEEFDVRGGSSSRDYEDEEYVEDLEEEEYASSSTSTSNETVPRMAEAKENGKFGDHIMVDNIAIKNEPKLMAEAVRTFMAMDDLPASQQPKQK